jgi:hypothetical protein
MEKNIIPNEEKKQSELEKLTKILLREIKEVESNINKSKLKEKIKNRVLGVDSDENT